MKKIDSKKILNSKNIFVIIISIAVLILLYIIYSLYSQNNSLKMERDRLNYESQTLKENLYDINQKYQNILSQIEVAEKDKLALFESLNNVNNNYNSLMQNYDNTKKEIDTLSKVVNIDDELLKKYSKYYFLNENYVPSSTVSIDTSFTNGKDIKILSDIADKLTQMLLEAKNQNIKIVIHSGYRSFAEQKSLKGNYVQKFGLTKSNQFSADQGYSEHQLGTAIDISDGVNILTKNFEKTETFKWMSEHAHRYGFILSYTKNNPYYEYEPWHYRYVGVELATYIYNNKLNFYDLEQKQIDTYKVKLFD
jgi:zinc D-Ala-D-Ala carboxypeptidase